MSRIYGQLDGTRLESGKTRGRKDGVWPVTSMYSVGLAMRHLSSHTRSDWASSFRRAELRGLSEYTCRVVLI